MWQRDFPILPTWTILKIGNRLPDENLGYMKNKIPSFTLFEGELIFINFVIKPTELTVL